jgi:hypothetical protein
MTIGLVQNARDHDMIEICGKNSSGWVYVWTTIHIDGIGDAVEGKLEQGDWVRLVECVIVRKDEWDQLFSDLEQAKQDLEAAEDEIAHLREEAQ